ncbi:MAG: phosphate signaling complex protein PhoU [Phycisphaerae bacterium]|nr:phosphate signaling complex protein PhoU [Phycisphaerae bacterium]
MSKHLQTEIERLKKMILTLGARVEESVRKAVTSIHLIDVELAREVIERDIDIDQTEVEVEEECLKILALHQPVAIDLRFIIAALKINNDLERIADLAVNVAERTAFLATQPRISVPFDFPTMAQKAKTMLKNSLDALVNMDAELAKKVCASDDEVDAINREMYEAVKDAIRQHPEWLDSLIHYLSVSRHIERIADHATNIAEDVIYMVAGEIVRHRPEDYTRSA